MIYGCRTLAYSASYDIFVLNCSRAQLSSTCNTLQINTNSSGFLHTYTRKVLLPHSKHYYQHPIYFPLCNTDFKSVRFMLHVLLLDYIYTSEHIKNLRPTALQTDAWARCRHWHSPLNIHELPWRRVSRHVWEWSRKPYWHIWRQLYIYNKCHIWTNSNLTWFYFWSTFHMNWGT